MKDLNSTLEESDKPVVSFHFYLNFNIQRNVKYFGYLLQVTGNLIVHDYYYYQQSVRSHGCHYSGSGWGSINTQCLPANDHERGPTNAQHFLLISTTKSDAI